MTQSDALHALVIFGSTFVLEDVAVLGAALLVVNSMISFPWAAASSFAGIWLGDLGLYWLAYHFGRPMFENAWFKRLIRKKVDLTKSESWFRDHGVAAILLSRAVPGTRLPTYLAAGLLKIPAPRFLAITGAACCVWVAILFWLSYHVGMMAISEFAMFRSEAGKLAACLVLAGALAWIVKMLSRRVSRTSFRASLKRIYRWEFWPPVIFYLPVALKYVLLGIRYRSLILPVLSNPGMHNGGLIGESKFETLADLERMQPEFVAETHLVPYQSVGQQYAEVSRLRQERGLTYPLVFKPNVGQRGYGFKVIHSDQEAKTYIASFMRDVLIQTYVPGPFEAGIFYYRRPNEETGHIFAITEKLFPAVIGDGQRTLEQLIREDERASIVADTYLQRFASDQGRILADGESFTLVKAGNHCQGAIFLDGNRLCCPDVERRIDEISRSIQGFFVGRYDIRYTSEEALRRGEGFKIIELNGASSEATSIYDPKTSLWSAYRTLFRQWEIVFEIGAENRRRGLHATPAKEIWRSWVQYQRRAALSPVSD